MKVKAQVHHSTKLLTFLKDKYGVNWSTKSLRWIVEHNRCQVNGFVERFCSMPLRKGDEVEVTLEEPPALEIPTLFEDETLLVINKPAYIASEKLSEILDLPLVHRLDRDTTGVMLFPKEEKMQKELEELFRRREMKKSYLAFVIPPPKKRGGVIRLPIEEREAITSWSLVKRYKDRALLRCRPVTGRTHQIRIHLKSLGSPVMGDVEYGGRFQKVERPLLHAERICYNNRSFTAPLPPDMELLC